MKARFVARRREMRRRGARATRATASFARVVARGARRAARGGVRKWSVDSRSREERDGGGGGEDIDRSLSLIPECPKSSSYLCATRTVLECS